MKKQALVLVTLALSVLTSSAHAADIQSVIQRLDAAEQQLSSAQAQVSYAKQELYQLLQAPQGPRVECVATYISSQYRAVADTEAEARQNLLFKCKSDRNNADPSGCDYSLGRPGRITCHNI